MIKAIYGILIREFGELEWWPSDSAFERVVGAILVQQTRWESVEKVVSVLKKKGLMTAKAMNSVSLEEMEEMVRPVGFYRQKARYLKGVAAYFSARPEKDGVLAARGPAPQGDAIARRHRKGDRGCDTVICGR